MNYSKGISWIDDCRIPFVDDENTNNWTSTRDKKPNKTGWLFRGDTGGPEMNTQGRFPANLLCSDDMLNDGSITGGEDYIITSKNNDIINWGFNNTTNRKVKQDKGSNSRYYDIDKWFNKLLDELQ